jgi:hypothetical protein
MDAKKRSRRRAITALVGVTAAAALLTAAPSQAVGRYTDAAGDSNGAPDIKSVAVLSDSSGQILFTIAVDGLTRGSQTGAALAIDSDVNPATGNPGWVGAEYLLILDEASSSYGFASWTGSAWNFDAPSSTVQIREVPGVLLVSINARELGGSQSLNFSAASFGATDAQFDNAPDEGHFNYTLAAGGPDIRRVTVQSKPAAPRAGATFTVTPATVELPPNGGLIAPTPAPESFTCVARLGAKALKGTGAGGCTFRIPKKNAKRKTLTVDVTVTYQGASKTVRQTYKVR